MILKIVADMASADRKKRFVVEYVVDFNGRQAAIRSGYSEGGADEAAWNLLNDPIVAAEIEERIREIASAKALTCQWVLDQWRQIAIADPTEACYIRVESCRHCWGINFAYQWTEFEYQEQVRAAGEHVCRSKCDQPCGKKFPPIALGGFNFDPKRGPNADCPMCHGVGENRVILVDSKLLKGPTRRLIAGIKQTQYGVEIKFRDQDRALENIAKWLQMLVDKREVSGPGGGPIELANITARDLSDDQLAQLIAGD